jgi:hypothetical protein
MGVSPTLVILAKAGIQETCGSLDSGLRRNDVAEVFSDKLLGLPIAGLVKTMNHNHRKLTIFMVIAWLLGSTLCGCAVRGSTPHTVANLGSPSLGIKNSGFWWAYRFKILWSAGEEPDLAVDVLLAHAVVKPVLREYQGKISYWRFHRRAAPDATGHQFSLLFYADPDTAAEVLGKIGESELLSEALAANMVERVIVDDPTRPTRPGVEDLSDPHWSPVLQRNWPAFIMGVSSLWLGLIEEAVAEVPGDSGELRALLERYRQADARVSSIWYKEGQHAFLHHLNAMFGYKPLLIKKEMSF